MNQDSASAPTLHPHGSCHYTRDIWHPIRGGTNRIPAVDAEKANYENGIQHEKWRILPLVQSSRIRGWNPFVGFDQLLAFAPAQDGSRSVGESAIG